MVDPHREEMPGVPADQADELAPYEADAVAAETEAEAEAEVEPAAETSVDASARLGIAFSRPAEAEDPLTREIERLREAPGLDADLGLEPATGDLPLTAQEAVFGKAPAPGRLNIGPQPHAFKIPIAYEPQPSFQTPEDVASIIGVHRPGDGSQMPRDLVSRHGDPEPRVQLMSEGRPLSTPLGHGTGGRSAGEASANDASGTQPTSGQTMPRVMITVSMANARSVFQECIERASQSLGAKFHSACQSTVDNYARNRRAAERAANRWSR